MAVIRTTAFAKGLYTDDDMTETRLTKAWDRQRKARDGGARAAADARERLAPRAARLFRETERGALSLSLASRRRAQIDFVGRMMTCVGIALGERVAVEPGDVVNGLANDATNLCLNVYGGTGPNIAFFKCTLDVGPMLFRAHLQCRR